MADSTDWRARRDESGGDREAGNDAGGIDETLIDVMLELTISDRLRTVSRYANALARFRRV